MNLQIQKCKKTTSMEISSVSWVCCSENCFIYLKKMLLDVFLNLCFFLHHGTSFLFINTLFQEHSL